jgi:predicted HTH domain antitoxin
MSYDDKNRSAVEALREKADSLREAANLISDTLVRNNLDAPSRARVSP